jgi:outer membrane protein assembly factor BamB
MGDGPRSTPTIADGRVYAFSGEGILAALELETGRIAWQHNAVAEHQGEPADYGMACSPLIVGEHVIVTVGAPAATVVAYERASGRKAWTAGRGDRAGYSSPALLELAGRPQVVVFAGTAALGLDPSNGDILWRYDYVTDFDCNIATPVAFEGQLLLSSGENHGSVLLRLKPSGQKFEIEEVWKSQGPQSVLRNEWQTSILLDGLLYGMDNVGSAGPVTHLTCVDAATGSVRWQRPRFGKGNLIAADGKLWISTVAGELVVVRAAAEKYEELGRATVTGPTRQAPSLSEGLLYLRDDREIVCVDVRAPRG